MPPLLPLSCALALLLALALAAPALHAASAETGPDLFAQPRVLSLKLEISPANLDVLKKEPKEYVKGALREGDQLHDNIGIRYKGKDTGAKPSFTVKFNEFISARHFHGQKKFTLENCEGDPSYLSAALAYDLFRAAGVPAPRHTFARVELNGRDLGFYLLAEGVNRDFLSRFFDKTKGNLYEGDEQDVTEKLDKDSGDTRTEQPDREALVAAAREADPAQRWKKLQTALDVERFLSFAAMEVLTCHTEGYCLKTNKYRLYQDPGTERMVFIPHGLELAFAKPDLPAQPEMRGLIARAVLQTPEGQRQYRERLAKSFGAHFQVDALHKRIYELAGVIRPALTAKDPAAGASFDQAIAQLRERIAQRARSLEKEVKR